MLTVFWFVVALGILVTFHEFGHYWVARRCGVKVHRFSVGFGKPLYSWYNKEGTEFAIAAIPLGGYVKMLDEREGDVQEHEKHMAFTQKSVWQRIAIVAAGPLANFILAVFLFWATLIPDTVRVAPVVATVEPASVADLAGVEPGQEIIAVDGVPTPNWNALSQALLYRLGETGEITLTTKYPDSDFEYESSAPIQSWMREDDSPDPFAGLGIKLYYPGVFAEVGGTQEQTPAADAGLRQGDRIVAIDGQALDGWEQMVEIVSSSPDKLMDFEIERNGQRFTQAIAPQGVEDGGKVIGRIGIYPPAWPEEMLRPYSRSIPEAFVAGVHKTWDTVGFVFMSIKKLIVGEISTKSLSGPFTIAKVAGDSAAAGWIVFVSVLAALSVNLGVLNLLPIPMLDGGHLLFYAIEALKGKPVSERVQIIGHQMGLFLVAGIMVLAFYNDLVRIFTGQLFG